MPAKAPVRHDPKPRRTDGVGPGSKLTGADPDRAYVFVNRYQGGVYDTSYFESLGGWAVEEGLCEEGERYRIEKYQEGGLRLALGKTVRPGEPLEYRGMVLMSCSKQFKELLEQRGPEGDSGQEDADRVEEIINRRGRVADSLSGIGSTNRRTGTPDIYLTDQDGRQRTYG